MTILENIRKIRKQKGISQEWMASQLGIDYSTYGKVERGKIELTVNRLERIALLLEIPIVEFFRAKQIEYLGHEVFTQSEQDVPSVDEYLKKKGYPDYKMLIPQKQTYQVEEITENTLREQFAGMIMQGLLANPSFDFPSYSKEAVALADELIKQLQEHK